MKVKGSEKEEIPTSVNTTFPSGTDQLNIASLPDSAATNLSATI